ncbi:Uncharacterised protein [uncultured archaeon]|nr:Uncharacterised protein [uncultured archaeon]
MQKFQDNLNNAIRHLQIADHMTYVTYPLVNDRRLLLKIFEEIYDSIINLVTSIIDYETLSKDLNIAKNEQEKIKRFFEIYSVNYLTTEQIMKIKEIIQVNEKHKQSAVEFVRKDKIVIMLDDLKTYSIDIKAIKNYLLIAKEFLMRANIKLKSE